MQSWKAALLLLFALPLAAYGIVHWTEQRYAALPYFGANNKVVDKTAAAVLPAFSFPDQNNRIISNQSLDQKIVVANYFFTSCPVVCPKMMKALQQVYQSCNNDSNILMISLTVDPLRDSSSKLKAYAAKKQLPDSWELLTGSKASLYYFARKGLYITATDGDGGPDDFIHSDYVVLLDRHQKIRGYYQGTSESAMKNLMADIKKLQHEQ